MKVRHIRHKPWLTKGPENRARRKKGRHIRRRAIWAAEMLAEAVRRAFRETNAWIAMERREAALRDLSRMSDEIGQELDEPEPRKLDARRIVSDRQSLLRGLKDR